MPAYVKIIVLAQAATILSLTAWMYQAYVNDVYFQHYVISLFQSNIIAGAVLSCTVMVWPAVLLLPQWSVAVHVRVTL